MLKGRTGFKHCFNMAKTWNLIRTEQPPIYHWAGAWRSVVSSGYTEVCIHNMEWEKLTKGLLKERYASEWIQVVNINSSQIHRWEQHLCC